MIVTSARTKQALATVAWLTETIRTHTVWYTHGDDVADTAIDYLNYLIYGVSTPDPEDLASVQAARDTLLALRIAVDELAGDLRRVVPFQHEETGAATSNAATPQA
jgi:hypothetical protein